MSYRRLWLAFAAVIVGSFAVLGYYGSEIYRLAPPIPGEIVTPEGVVVAMSPQGPAHARIIEWLSHVASACA